MRQFRSLAPLLFVAAAGIACESTSPSSTVSLTGVVRESGSNGTIAGATVTVQGQTATSGGTGGYTVSNLTSGNAEVRVTHQGHINVTQNVALSGTTTFDPQMPVEPRMAYNGNWSGNWVNNASQNAGTGTMVISVNSVAQTILFTIDLNGLVFGIPDPTAVSFTGSYTAAGVTVNVPTPFGTITATIAAGGQINGNVVAAPGLPITRIDFTGTATPAAVTINFTLTLVGGATHPGVITFNKVS